MNKSCISPYIFDSVFCASLNHQIRPQPMHIFDIGRQTILSKMCLREKNNEEIEKLLTEYGIKHGPVVASTRSLYEQKLLKAMEEKEDTQSRSSNKTYYKEEEPADIGPGEEFFQESPPATAAAAASTSTSASSVRAGPSAAVTPAGPPKKRARKRPLDWSESPAVELEMVEPPRVRAEPSETCDDMKFLHFLLSLLKKMAPEEKKLVKLEIHKLVVEKNSCKTTEEGTKDLISFD